VSPLDAAAATLAAFDALIADVDKGPTINADDCAMWAGVCEAVLSRTEKLRLTVRSRCAMSGLKLLQSGQLTTGLAHLMTLNGNSATMLRFVEPPPPMPTRDTLLREALMRWRWQRWKPLPNSWRSATKRPHWVKRPPPPAPPTAPPLIVSTMTAHNHDAAAAAIYQYEVGRLSEEAVMSAPPVGGGPSAVRSLSRAVTEEAMRRHGFDFGVKPRVDCWQRPRKKVEQLTAEQLQERIARSTPTGGVGSRTGVLGGRGGTRRPPPAAMRAAGRASRDAFWDTYRDG
jgi:hypothetical protein